MRRKSPISVRFLFEDTPPRRGSQLASLGRGIASLLKNSPLSVSETPLFQSAKAIDWFSTCGEGGGAEAGSQSSPLGKRLRAIKLGDDVLMERTYGKDGELASVVYADGEQVRFLHDERTGAVSMRSRQGVQVEGQVRLDDRIESLSYSGGARFRFAYDVSGRLQGITYPDGVKTALHRTANGRLAGVTVGSMRTMLRWQSDGGLNGYATQVRGSLFEVAANARTLESTLTFSGDGTKGGMVESGHPLGLWRFAPGGRLREAVLPFGERLVVQKTEDNRPKVVWTPAGQTQYEYDPEGVLSAVIDHTGDRTMCHRLHDRTGVLLVSSVGVTLLDYDQSGRLRRTRQNTGVYSIFRHSRAGGVSRVDTFDGWIKLGRDDQGRLNSVRWPGGFNCTIVHDTEGRMSGYAVTSRDGFTVHRVAQLSTTLWQWLALEPTLRLVDTAVNGEEKVQA